MARITYIPHRVIDLNGIADGASIYVYQSGTTTPITIYSNPTFTTPLSNPYVVATGASVPPIYVNYSGDIRLYIVSNSGDIYDEDPYATFIQSGEVGNFAPANVATRTALAAITGMSAGHSRYLTESGREGLFVFSSSNLSSQITADSRQGVYVAPASDTTGASGAWVRKYSGPLNINWFGAVADCTSPGTGTDNAAAINGAIAVAAITKGREVLVPRNNLGYRVASTITITGGIKLKGEAYSQSPVATYPTAPQHLKGSLLVFDANVAGLQFFAFTDNNANATVVEFESAYSSVLEDIILYGGGGTTVTAHGLETRTLLHARNVRVENFAGEGLRINATTASLAVPYGNANGSKFDHCFFNTNLCHGAHLKGTDANGIIFSCCQFTTNGGLGVLDESGIGGNGYIGCLFEVNNLSYGTVSNQRTQVTTDFAGLSAQNFGSIAFTSTNVAHSVIHCYNETGGNGMKAHLPVGVVVIGSLMASPTSWDATSSPTAIDGFNGYAYLGGIKAQGTGTTMVFDPQIVFNRDLGWGGVSSDARINYSATGGLMMGGMGSAQDFTLFNKNALSVCYVNTGTRDMNFQGAVTLNAGNLNLTNGNIVSTVGNLTLTSGNATLSAGNLSVTGSMLSTHATAGVGYTTGAGGTATQTTSRTTGVTVNKACGSITLVSAAGSATYASFTVTNSAIGANDTVRVCQKSGTDKYMTHVTNVQAGSFEITFATTGGTTTEQPVFNFAVIKGAAS